MFDVSMLEGSFIEMAVAYVAYLFGVVLSVPVAFGAIHVVGVFLKPIADWYNYSI